MKSEQLINHSTIVGHAPDFKETTAAIFSKFKSRSESVIQFLIGKVLAQDANTVELNRAEKLLDAVRKARDEWMIAKSNFLMVSDDDLVDQAIYTIAAAEKRYLYLLKLARKEKLTSGPDNIDLNRMLLKNRDFNN